MTATAREIESNADWLPHRIDPVARRVEFLRIPPSAYGEPGFLADFRPAAADGVASLAFEEVAALDPVTGPLHFVFHTAFCRSTLLARALNIEGVSIGLAEPGIIASLANFMGSGGQEGAELTRAVLRLLARRRAGGEAVFVKPTNHANRLIPLLLDAAPSSRAILMTNGLEPFLGSIARRGLMGRRWGRSLFLELQAYAPVDFGLDRREMFLATDMQVAGMAWVMGQNHFASLLSGPQGGRLAVLDGDRFNAERARTLGAVLGFAGLAAPPEAIAAAADGPAFATHAKLGQAFSGPQDTAHASKRDGTDEIGQVAHWVSLIAAQMGPGVPLAQTLF
ncbi:hypothetical protein [Erythrobacter sp.]|uniref:hypothetical protein n=1 Tax=Erythrobacter sp. TaxID=1042 RepID=UPI0025B916A4|nr:hypothetical protein [Erythrobacter sp.]